ncbi:MAG: hypothetical protein AMXMBFR52_13810 [Burkholderiales bacterium]
MNMKRYVARTAKEALGQARAELGADAIVLANRPVAAGVEIVAMAEAAVPGAQTGRTAVARAATTNAHGVAPAGAAMSTVDFQTYVRERQQRRSEPAPVADRAADLALAGLPGADPLGGRPRSGAEGTAELMAELRAMRGFIAEQIESVSWFEGMRKRPVQARLLRWLLRAGFSPSLSRTLMGRLPDDVDETQAQRWLHEALRQELPCITTAQTIFDEGGVFALLGPTGVGKTTTAAKIAAQFALRNGVQSVGLITADVYRVGAQDQLRTFGRLLGVPVHVAHDVAGLTDFLQLFMNRKLVLIDTAGVGQRDERVGELLAALSSTRVRRVVVIDAAMQAEAIDEVATVYQAEQAAGVVLSKVDEAVQLGGALDCLIRRRLELQGVADGQRVPEDWHRPDIGTLVQRALASAGDARPTPFDFDDAELAMLMAACPVHAGPALAEARGV